jgi:hypothetical protein
MKRLLAVLFAGAMLSSAAFAADSDPFREERYKAKFGRYTPAEEARRAALVPKKLVGAEKCTSQDCCSGHAITTKTAVSDSAAFTEAWAQAKFGRSLRRESTCCD